MSYIVGVDTGGTFTDLVSINTETGDVALLKYPSNPETPDASVLGALRTANLNIADVTRFVHGTTVSTNAILERKGATVGLLTTAGFEDTLEIGRIDRAHLYDLSWSKPASLVPRHLRVGIRERLSNRGKILTPLDVEQVREVVREFREKGVKAIAVCFLHAYANPEHEKAVRSIIEKDWPEVTVSISSEVMNAIREFERTSSVVVDAYVKPIMSRYLSQLEHSLRDAGMKCPLRVMQSSGGVMTSEDCGELPVHTLLSGPAGGVTAARNLAAQYGHNNVITIDIGGTSADVALICNGKASLTTETEVDWGIPVQVPMIDIRTIGAGGGSIAWIDKGGRLKVGPESAGARPGPACFGHGGVQATVTDANLVLGYLSPGYYAGGAMSLDRDKAVAAIKAKVADPLGYDVPTAARGMLNIINANMRDLIRQISVQQGYDPRDFSLMAFGGGGPVHAVSIARELGIRSLLIPTIPGVLSAFGLLLAAPRHDFVSSLPRVLDSLDPAEFEVVLERMVVRGRELLERAGITVPPTIEVSVDMRYERQNYTLNVALAGIEHTSEALSEAFTRAYEQKYGYHMDDQPIELVAVRVTVLHENDEATLTTQATSARKKEKREPLYRDVYFEEQGEFRPCLIARRDDFDVGDELPVPCIVEQSDTSTVIPPHTSAEVMPGGMILIKILEEQRVAVGDTYLN
jgi:N-methylhydantoinase A